MIKQLIKSGHGVIGLVRSKESAARLNADGVQAYLGDLNDLDSLRAGIEKADGVIHTGFIHDFTRFKECCELDRKVIATIGDVLKNSKRPFVITSAVGILPAGKLVDESTAPTLPNHNPRFATEEAFQEIVGQGINASLVRLPPTTHGLGDHGFVPTLIKIAKLKGLSAYVDDGQNTWPAVHRFDAAELFVLALLKAQAGARYHAVAEEGVPFKEIARAIASGLGIEARSLNAAEAKTHFADFATFAHFVTMNLKASSATTRRELNWQPKNINLLEDLRDPGYFPVG